MLHKAGRILTRLISLVLLIVGFKVVNGSPNAIPKHVNAAPPVGVPIKFTIPADGYVSLVIENEAGFRVRNLVSETWFKAGENVVWWDGTDDLHPDGYAAAHGVYHLKNSFVEPGRYKVRGIYRKDISARYQFSVYHTGVTPWNTADHTGAWLANHTPPQAAIYVSASRSSINKPLIFLGSYLTEGADGLIWTDLDGHKLGGKRWVGGTWTAAPFLTTDNGPNPIAGIVAYVASTAAPYRDVKSPEIRISAIMPNNGDFQTRLFIKLSLDKMSNDDVAKTIGGIAVNNGIAVVSLPLANKLLLFDMKSRQQTGSIDVQQPHGVVFNSAGNLLVLSGNDVLRYKYINDDKPEVLIKGALQEPYGIALDRPGNIYVSDRGDSHNVKVFDPNGKLVRQIGKPGSPRAGLYDPLKMNNPAGITIDEKDHLWVTEQDPLPKRVSIWSLDGKLINAFYGPTKYGGGGTLDQAGKNKFYYADGGGAMEFELDWQKGTSALKSVYYRKQPTDVKFPFRAASPERALYYNGQRYFTNCFNSNPTGGSNTAMLFIERDGVVNPIVAMGKATDWDILKTDEFKGRWPAGVDLNSRKDKDDAFFIWQDNNSDGKPQPNEVSFTGGVARGVTIMPDLSFCIANLDSATVKFSPVSFSDKVPKYDIQKREVLLTGVLPPASSGGVQALSAADGYNIVTLGVKPYDKLSISGGKNGKLLWTYPDMWPGLHASQHAPVPAQPGILIGTTRLLGEILEFKDPSRPKLWALNGNHGSMYLFTDDGIMVATVFKDKSLGKQWSMPHPERNMRVDTLTLAEENFWPTITKTSDDEVYLVNGAWASIVKIEGLETIKRLPEITVYLSAADIKQSHFNNLAQDAAAQQALAAKHTIVSILTDKPGVDGNISEWHNADWVLIEAADKKAKDASGNPLPDLRAGLAVCNGRLYAAYQTGDKALLRNTGDDLQLLFKTGGALDLMIGTSAKADTNRRQAVKGDTRILVAMVNNKPKVMLYQQISPGAKQNVAFTSPVGSITFDRIEDITNQVEFAAKDGNYEFSVPLSVIELKPADGLKIKGDMGVLRGANGQTVSRIYWSNKATGITADVPSEAMLKPNFWGTFIFRKK